MNPTVEKFYRENRQIDIRRWGSTGVLLAVCLHADETGRCLAGVRALRETIGSPRPTVLENLRRLQREGILILSRGPSYAPIQLQLQLQRQQGTVTDGVADYSGENIHPPDEEARAP